MAHLLLIDDDESFGNIVTGLLKTEGYTVTLAYTGQSGLNALERVDPDLVVLDLRLPDMTGFEVLKKIRGYSSVPVIILSAHDQDPGKVRALEGGADDYITKPFHEEELVARISALLRRVSWSPKAETVLEIGRLRVDMARRHVTLQGKTLHLTPNEYAILCILMQKVGKVVTHKELLTSVWGPGYEGDFSVLRVNISRLRQKIETLPRCPEYILTVPRKGYRMPTNL